MKVIITTDEGTVEVHEDIRAVEQEPWRPYPITLEYVRGADEGGGSVTLQGVAKMEIIP